MAISTVINSRFRGKLLTLHVINTMLITKLISYHSVTVNVDNDADNVDCTSITLNSKKTR